MTPWTELKATAIMKACEIKPWNLAAIVAMLTSQSKEEREQGKVAVREMAREGRTIMEREQRETELRTVAERFEP